MSTTIKLEPYKCIPRETLRRLPKFGEARQEGNPQLHLALHSSKQKAVFYVIEYDPETGSFYGFVETPLDSDFNTLTTEILDVHRTKWNPEFRACRFEDHDDFFLGEY